MDKGIIFEISKKDIPFILYGVFDSSIDNKNRYADYAFYIIDYINDQQSSFLSNEFDVTIHIYYYLKRLENKLTDDMKNKLSPILEYKDDIIKLYEQAFKIGLLEKYE